MVVIYLISRKFHPDFGIPGTEVTGKTRMEIAMKQGRGWEWLVQPLGSTVVRNKLTFHPGGLPLSGSSSGPGLLPPLSSGVHAESTTPMAGSTRPLLAALLGKAVEMLPLLQTERLTKRNQTPGRPDVAHCSLCPWNGPGECILCPSSMVSS